MDSKLIDMATSQGIWAVLFIILFLYIIRDTKQRENKYQEMIVKLSDIISTEIKDIKDTVKDFCARRI